MTTNTGRRGSSRSARPAAQGASAASPSQASSAGHPILELQRRAGNRAIAGLVANADTVSVARKGPSASGPAAAGDSAAKAPTTVTLKVKWDHTTPPQSYLKAVFDKHPVDWTADVSVNGKSKGEGQGELDVEVPAKTKVTIKVTPKATKPDDFYRAKSTTAKKGYETATTVKVALAYNRENQRFTDASWEKEGLDPDKVGKVKTYTMLDRKIQVNELVKPTVDATNKYFESNKLTDAERTSIKDSIVNIGGYNRRTTSSGSFSNHSIGSAVDINDHMPTKQNHHFKKSGDTGPADKRVLELFQHVVVLDSGWKDYDPWKESKPSRILEASTRFNQRFPRFLGGLLDDALGQGWDTGRPVTETELGPTLMQRVDDALLKKGIDAAKAAKKADTEKWLGKIRADWGHVRAWVEGIVVYKKKHAGKAWAYASDHAKAKPGSTPDVKGTLTGMVSLHEKLVETMTAGGWSWLVDHAKDYMHFEDRAAAAAMKK